MAKIKNNPAIAVVKAPDTIDMARSLRATFVLLCLSVYTH